MSEPLVCAIMLTKDRPQMAKRAVECFRRQTYRNKFLAIFDNGAELGWYQEGGREGYTDIEGSTIGELRNKAIANTLVVKPEDSIIVHWDDDDWSHPNRISEQVALLQASGKQVVGYRDMLFWETADRLPYESEGPTRAWLYTNNDPRYALGTSLCYWRETWEKRPFKAISAGEDKEFLRDRDTLGVSSLFTHGEQKHPDDCKCGTCGPGQRTVIYGGNCEPRMIASIHSGNHVTYQLTPNNWKRVPEFDDLCRKTMSL